MILHKILAIIDSILVIIVSAAAIAIVPEFIKLFSGFGAELPLITKAVIASYQYWVLLLILPLGVFINYLFKPPSSKLVNNVILIGLIMLMIIVLLTIPFVVMAMYMPIFQMGKII